LVDLKVGWLDKKMGARTADLLASKMVAAKVEKIIVSKEE
jgi:hypothetical protein